MIGYMTDFQFIGTAARSVGLTSASSPRLGMLATLDHTTHYYPFPESFDPRRPMLHVMEAAMTDVNSGRGIVRGLLYTEDGVLISVTSQEGVVRPYIKKKEPEAVEGEKAKL
jgi:acyl-CoA thioesterase 8